MRTLLSPAVLLAAAAASYAISSQAMAQPTSPAAPKAAAADLPVTRVSLFSSGVGFFEHAGSINGDGSALLHFKTDQINDVLKSLVLQDQDGGTVSTVSYQSQDPLDHALSGFQVDLSGAPAISQLLAQLRGAEVVVDASAGKFTGKILGVETRKRAAGGDKGVIVEVPTLTLVTSAGMQAVSIDDADSITLTDPKLQDELNKALAAVAGARGSDKKTVTVNFKGTGDRRVRMGYVVGTPIWKASYRLTLAGDKKDDKTNLQGWAIVENQTDSDWNHIALSLVSGRPLSFMMDLYEPIYLQRPTAKLELFAGLTPQTYAEAREEVDYARGGAPAAAAPVAKSMRARMQSEMGARDMAYANQSDTFMTAGTTVTAQASSGQLGELFEYALTDITLARQSSAMVPIVAEPIEARSVSIYNHDVLARYPLNGARIKNTTDKHLLQGPITVFSSAGYAGDAQINNVPPGQERLISYGIDLATLIDAEKTENNDEVQTVKLVKGILTVSNRTTSAHHFAMQNRSDKTKTIIIEERKNEGWDLVDTDKPVEMTDKIYRFERKIEPKLADDFVVKQSRINWQTIALVNTDVNTLIWYSRHDKTPGAVKDAIKKAMDLRQEQTTLDRQIAEQNEELRKITEEQNRIRENMKTVDSKTAYYTRLMAKLDAQESTIEKAQTKAGELTEARDAKKKELEDYLNTLTIE
jgi:hypothetical protein